MARKQKTKAGKTRTFGKKPLSGDIDIVRRAMNLWQALSQRRLLVKHLIRWGSIVTVTAAFVMVIVTALSLTGLLSFGRNLQFVPALIYLDIALLLIIAFIVTRHIIRLVVSKRRGSTGSKLHVRMLLIFALLTIIPTVTLALASALFLDLGIKNWFSERVHTALQESVSVSRAYLNEHADKARFDIYQLASSIDQEHEYIQSNQQRLENVLKLHVKLRNISEAVIFGGSGEILARAGITLTLEAEPIALQSIEQAQAGEIVTFINSHEDRVRALTRLNVIPGTILYIGRLIDPQVLAHVIAVQRSVQEFQEFDRERIGIEISFTLMFAMLALLLMLSSSWVGFHIAQHYAEKLTTLIDAADRIGGGDLQVRVPVIHSEDEFAMLGQAFNRMAERLNESHSELVLAYQHNDSRRRFIEAVLSGAKSGIIGLDRNLSVTIANQAVSELLGVDLSRHIGKKLSDAVPKLAPVMAQLQDNIDKAHSHFEAQHELNINGTLRYLLIRVIAGQTGNRAEYIMSFDDLTEMLAMQRKAAWSGVARYIAHEIKNPLTPIQLATERLKRRFSAHVATDKDRALFQELTDVVIRQVGELQRLVDSFSRFARMPQAVIIEERLADIINEVVLLERHSGIVIESDFQLPDDTTIDCDRQMIRQALTNLVQNAVEMSKNRHDSRQARVDIKTCRKADHIIIDVIDNGPGLPDNIATDQLFEPYFTMRQSGSGLGLAVVKNIMSEHHGYVELFNRTDQTGATARLKLPDTGKVSRESKNRQDKNKQKRKSSPKKKTPVSAN